MKFNSGRHCRALLVEHCGDADTWHASEAPCLQMLPAKSVTPLDWGWRVSRVVKCLFEGKRGRRGAVGNKKKDFEADFPQRFGL